MNDDVTQWLQRLADGDESAAQGIWEEYFEKLVRLARKRLEGLSRRVADEEDVALSAMKSFFRGMAAGRYPQLNDREDLWKLLVTITAHKAIAELRRQRALKRGGGNVRGLSAFSGKGEEGSEAGGIEQVMGREPTPEFACFVADNCSSLFDRLDQELREIALAKMEGFTHEEIAKSRGVTVRTIERKVARIRGKWEQGAA